MTVDGVPALKMYLLAASVGIRWLVQEIEDADGLTRYRHAFHHSRMLYKLFVL